MKKLFPGGLCYARKCASQHGARNSSQFYKLTSSLTLCIIERGEGRGRVSKSKVMNGKCLAEALDSARLFLYLLFGRCKKPSLSFLRGNSTYVQSFRFAVGNCPSALSPHRRPLQATSYRSKAARKVREMWLSCEFYQLNLRPLSRNNAQASHKGHLQHYP